jgi:hypothetical protein
MSTLKFNRWQSIDGVTRNAVLQVVSAEISTSFTTTSETFVDVTDMSLAITPTSSTSKVLVSFTPHVNFQRSSTAQYFAHQILRDSTVIFAPWVNNGTGNFATGFSAIGATIVAQRGFIPIQFLDSPATTNEIVYKLQIALYENDNSGTMTINETSTSGLQKSVITLMEIAQ